METNIRVISPDGGDFGCFFEIDDLYAKLSGVKDNYGENMEFIEIGNHIQLKNSLLKVVDINLKFENIDLTTKHFNKSKISTPKNLIIEMIITVKFLKKIKTFANTVYN